MPHPIFTVPASARVGLTSISLGLLRCLDRQGINVGFYKPVEQLRYGPRSEKSEEVERSTALIEATTPLKPPAPLSARVVEEMLADGSEDLLQQEIVANFQKLSSFDAVIIEGLITTEHYPFAERVNRLIADALDAEVVVIGDGTRHESGTLLGDLRLAEATFGDRITGCIVNRVASRSLSLPPSLSPIIARTGSANQHTRYVDKLHDLEEAGFRVIGAVPTISDFGAYRVSDLAAQLGVHVIEQGDWENRRVRHTRICARRIEFAHKAFTHGSLLVVPADRDDIFVGAALATFNGVQLAGLLVTGPFPPSDLLLEFCGPAISTGLPVLHLKERTYESSRLLNQINDEIHVSDRQRASLVMNGVANHIDTDWVQQLSHTQHAPRLSPAAFRHRLVEGARAAHARIVLPEGTEPRILRAAHVCSDMGIARPVLLGDRKEIEAAARRTGIELAENIEIISPLTPPESYVQRFIELRKHRGFDSPEKAIDALSDVTTYGTMMMKMGDADGLVSGAIHSTAQTIRPALSLIKTREGASIVSSVFFMCLPDQVLVFGDCAVNPNPTAEQLADIAIQSAESAEAFGIPPRVALISYSTGTSGGGSEVEKVRTATELAQKARPDIPIDGPLQYDAAINAGVANTKAPKSTVAGNATVIVFPDLNTGNTTYKAVQRSAHVLSIGPMLQGLALPVNDLSRGATVDDIVYTVALTAMQAAAARGN